MIRLVIALYHATSFFAVVAESDKRKGRKHQQDKK